MQGIDSSPSPKDQDSPEKQQHLDLNTPKAPRKSFQRNDKKKFSEVVRAKLSNQKMGLPMESLEDLEEDHKITDNVIMQMAKKLVGMLHQIESSPEEQSIFYKENSMTLNLSTSYCFVFVL